MGNRTLMGAGGFREESLPINENAGRQSPAFSNVFRVQFTNYRRARRRKRAMPLKAMRDSVPGSGTIMFGLVPA